MPSMLAVLIRFANLFAEFYDLLIHILTHVRNFTPDACNLLVEMVNFVF